MMRNQATPASGRRPMEFLVDIIMVIGVETVLILQAFYPVP
jgi:hypothetical protein